jgi:hypothetical protein
LAVRAPSIFLRSDRWTCLERAYDGCLRARVGRMNASIFLHLARYSFPDRAL